MTTPLPILRDGLEWKPGTCMSCGEVGHVLHDRDATVETHAGDGDGCCPSCCTALWTLMTSTDFTERVEAPWRDY